jgi:site-specific DNA recombinase
MEKIKIRDVAMLLRISRDKGENEDTLQSHRNRLIRLCNERGYKYTIYEEIVSGQARIADREALNRLLQELEKYDAVVVMDTDRLSRDLEFSIHLWKRFEQAGVPIITPSRTYTEHDFMTFAVEAVMAHQEYKQITKRQRQGKLERLHLGQWIQGRCPLGFTRGDDRKLVINESEAEVIRSIFALAEQGYGMPAIVKRLPYKTAKGESFTVATVHNILHNQAYIGTISYTVKKGRNPESIVTKNAHPAIISREQWNNVQLALQSRMPADSETRTRSRGICHSILKDLTYCSNCGRKLSYRPDSKLKHLIYLRECKGCGMKGVNEKRVLEAFLREFIWLEVQLGDQWKKALEGANSHDKQGLEQSVASLQKTADKLNKRLKAIKIQRLDGELSKLDAEEIEQETKAELKRCQTALDDLLEQIQQSDVIVLENHYKMKMKLINQFKQSQKDVETANRILKLLIHKVTYERMPKGYLEEMEQFRMDEDEYISDIKIKIELK